MLTYAHVCSLSLSYADSLHELEVRNLVRACFDDLQRLKSAESLRAEQLQDGEAALQQAQRALAETQRALAQAQAHSQALREVCGLKLLVYAALSY